MRILSVSQAVSHLRELMENDLVLGDVWISGEVSGPRLQPSGHCYFVLKDSLSQLRGVMFRSAYTRLQRSSEYLQQGAQVIVHGRMTVYEARGELQIVVDFVQPEGVGLRHAQFEKLRQQLEEEGLFDASRKRPLPRFPRRIGVVTSPVGAVFHDICNILRRRWPLAQVVLAPTASTELAQVRLRDVPVGGSTPLAAGMLCALDLLEGELRRNAEVVPWMVLVTDGRGNVGLDGGLGSEDARTIAARLRSSAVNVLVLDTAGPGSGAARELARAADADYVRLSTTSADGIVESVRSRLAGRS